MKFQLRKRFKQSTLHCERLEARNLLAADLLAHWQAQDLSNEGLNDGDTVSAWSDGVGAIVAQGDGQPVLSATALGGKPGIKLDPSDGEDWLVVPQANNPLQLANNFAVSVVFSTSSNSLQGGGGDWFENTALVDSASSGFGNGWGISINSAGELSAGLGGGFGSPALNVSSGTALNDGQTHLVIFSRSGNEISLQIDDEEPVTVVANDKPVDRLELSIGAQKLGGNAFDGLIAEVRAFDDALTSEDAQALYGEFVATYDNQAPTANPDSYTLQEDATFFAVPLASGVLANDTDNEGDALTATLVDSTQNGRVTLNDDGTLIYIPDPDFSGVDSFTYSASDFRPSAPATVTLNVTPVYDGAVPVADNFKTTPGAVLTVDAADGLLANDANPDQATLRVVLDQDVDQGELTLNQDGSFSYDARGVAGTKTFTYRIDDGTQNSAPATVTIVANTPPSAVANSYVLNEDSLLAVSAATGVLNNDTDADGDALTAELVDAPSGGTLGLAPDGSFTYSPMADLHGQDSFTYRVTDGEDSSEVATVSLVINSVNDLPVAVADSYFTLPGVPLNVQADRGVLSNDSDVDGPEARAILETAPSNGQLQLMPDGSLTYTPNEGFLGTDLFSYRFDDGLDRSAVTEVEVSVSTRPVLISELNAANANGLETKTRATVDDDFPREADTPDWIEIQNLVSAPIDISGMHLTDDSEDLTKWAFPEGTTIAPNGYLVVFASGENIRDTALDENGFLHTNFGLGANGDYLAITAVDGSPIHEYSPGYPVQTADVSYGLVDDQQLYFGTPTPGAPNGPGVTGFVADTSFSVKRGYFTEPFDVTFTTATPGATLVYTIDGEEPTLENGIKVEAASADVPPTATLTIDATTNLRVSAFKGELLPTNVDTQTYFFVDDIVQQSTLWDTVTDDPKWAPQLKESFLSVPTISIVMDGRISSSRETPTSVELIYPDGTEGFQIDAGIEHYGGHSLNSPKKNIRLSFRTEYGDSKLNYDFFGEGAADEFDQILLRTGSHDNWFWTHPAGGRGNYLRGRWAFDRQQEMGQLAPHGRYMQVFINGEYAGMHHLMERPDASFMASYLGGSPDDYDALNAGTPIDGDATAWRALQSADVMSDYDEVQKYMDVENYADYMLLQFYAGNDWDWNHSQNWAGARKREDGAGYIFFSWDSDVMLRTTANANVINRGGPGNLWNVRGGMKQHDEFLMLMADRAHRYFFNGGMLTSERLRADMNALADEVRLPVIAETARWGRQGGRYTPDVWEQSVEWMLDRFAPENGTDRTATVLSQLRRANVYPDIDAPEYTVNGTRQHGGAATADDMIDFVASEGTVYYTLGGSDPRLTGGAINPEALVFDGAPFRIGDSKVVKSRLLNNGQWSALSEAEFVVDTIPADATSLRITEVNFHPANPTDAEIEAGHGDGDDFEFLELMNISEQSIDLSEVRFQFSDVDGNEQGIEFAFGQGSITRLAPGERVLVVEDISAFVARYGDDMPVAGQWSGGLSNRSEQITLRAGESVIHQFTYSDEWYAGTDGVGRTLEIASAAQSLELWGERSGWRESASPGGSPGSEGEVNDLPGDANRDGIFNSADLILIFQASEFEDDIDGNSTWEEGDWDGDGDFTTSDLVAAFKLGHYSAEAKQNSNHLNDDAMRSLFAASQDDKDKSARI